MAEFSDEVDAMSCGIAIQRSLCARNRELAADRRMHVRIGVHRGILLALGSRLYGDVVNTAARLQAAAEPQAIAVTEATAERVPLSLATQFQDARELALKNVSRTVRILQRRFQSSDLNP